MAVNPPIRFLLIEDDPVDVQLFQRSMKKHNLTAIVERAADGKEGLELLRRNVAGPLIVFLDLNMPGVNGHDFLEDLRADEELRRTIVFVLTSSDHDRDIAKAYDKNVAGYFNKDEINSLMEVVTKYSETVYYPPASA